MAKKSGGPCWDGYEMVGMKMKGGRKVPNCVPVKKKFAGGLIPDVSSAMAMASQASPQDYKDYKMSGNIKPQKIEAKQQEVVEQPTEAYSGKFINVEMDGKKYSNPSLKSYYGDLLK